MTHAELYEIVKDHRDVWGDVLAFCDYNDASYWASRVARGNYSVQCSEATAEAALLGLGVKWLASGGGTGNSYINLLLINASEETHVEVWTVPPERTVYKRLTNPVAAVYAAIGKVKLERGA